MWKSLLVQRTIPLSVSYLLLILAGIALDNILHIAHLVWVGRYLGIVGTIFFAISAVYSARKSKLIKSGSLKFFLKLHCHSGWIATLMIIVHSGVHFNAILPWAATALMMVVTASGHVGQHLIKKLKDEAKLKMKQLGVDPEKQELAENEQYWDNMTLKALEQWRAVHRPLVAFLVALTSVHIISIFFFWNWR